MKQLFLNNHENYLQALFSLILPYHRLSEVLITLSIQHPGPGAAATVCPWAWGSPPALNPEVFVGEWCEAVTVSWIFLSGQGAAS